MDIAVIVAIISVIVNIIQVIQNLSLKEKLKQVKQDVGDNSDAVQQTHSGKGDNVNVGGNATIKK